MYINKNFVCVAHLDKQMCSVEEKKKYIDKKKKIKNSILYINKKVCNKSGLYCIVMKGYE